MILKRDWTILTVGDGDLSFSRSIFEHHQPKHLTATVYDSSQQLKQKYGSEHLDYLNDQSKMGASCQVITDFDITHLQTVQSLNQNYDVVIFQFPLVPNFSSADEFAKQTQAGSNTISVNTINRRLLRLFLKNSFDYLLSKTGAQLAYISSKDVKPYTEWDIEYSLTTGTELVCMGSLPFKLTEFPGYKIRNVDRDKHVKDTAAFTYVYSTQSNQARVSPLLVEITPTQALLGNNGCDICHAGPFATEQEKTAHLAGKKHQRMRDFSEQWSDYLNQ